MYSAILRLFAVACALQAVAAQTPPGFNPAISTHLAVTYNNTAVYPAGITVLAADASSAPILDLPGTSNGTYVSVLIDFSVSLNGPTAPNTTLLHWILPGLSYYPGTKNLTSTKNEIAPYFSPGPPAGQTHTYGVFLYAEPANFAVPADYIPYFNNITASVFNRIGFNLTNFVVETGLGAPIAADWFVVSTPNTTTISPSSNATRSGSASSASASVVKSSGAGKVMVETIITAFGIMMVAFNFL